MRSPRAAATSTIISWYVQVACTSTISSKKIGLIEALVSNSSVVVDGDFIYVSLRTAMGCAQLQLMTAAHEFCALANINAHDKYARVLGRLYPRMSTLSVPVADTKKSICSDTRRKRVAVINCRDGPIVDYIPHELLIENTQEDTHFRNTC